MNNVERMMPQAYQESVDAGLPAAATQLNPATMNSQAAREIGEIQGAIIVAQRCPRNEAQAFKNILNACKRPTLAKTAQYAYPRGGQLVKGPSIRLAEVLARYWGNLQFGVRELARTKEETLFEAYCWDVETNTRISKRFSQRHWRDKKNNKGHALTDERDIYEAVANAGSRRMRSCILGIIPGDIVEEAVAQCERTQNGDVKLPLSDQIRGIVVSFDKHGVTQEMIEVRLGHELKAVTQDQINDLRDIFISIKDGASKRDDWFEAASPKSREDQLTERYSKDEPTAVEKKPDSKVSPTPQTTSKKPKSPKEPAPEPKSEPSEFDNTPASISQATRPVEKTKSPETESVPAKKPQTVKERVESARANVAEKEQKDARPTSQSK